LDELGLARKPESYTDLLELYIVAFHGPSIEKPPVILDGYQGIL
jgi:hypothetical protein